MELIIKTYSDEEYNRAERALEIKLQLAKKTFTQALVDTLFLKINDPSFKLEPEEILYIYEMLSEVKNNTPKGNTFVQEFKKELVENYIKEQKLYENQ